MKFKIKIFLLNFFIFNSVVTMYSGEFSHSKVDVDAKKNKLLLFAVQSATGCKIFIDRRSNDVREMQKLRSIMIKFIHALLNKGADLNTLDSLGLSVFAHAEDDKEVMEILDNSRKVRREIITDSLVNKSVFLTPLACIVYQYFE